MYSRPLWNNSSIVIKYAKNLQLMQFKVLIYSLEFKI